jgi:hypothetical protein
MKSNELRIGNWVSILETEVYREINSLRLREIDIGLETTLRPILLTKEWLLKFGFKKGVKGWFKTFDKNKKFNLYMYNPNIYKNVNQMQNLYFAITGDELIIK